MVGGYVLATIERDDRTTLVVRGVGSEANDVTHVDVESGADVETDDSVWWQSGEVFVTRGSRFEKVFEDRPVKKVGYSYGGYHLRAPIL